MTLEAVCGGGAGLAASFTKRTVASGSVSEVTRRTSLESFVGKSGTSVIGQVVTSEALLASTDGGLTSLTVGDGASLTLVFACVQDSVVPVATLAVDRGISTLIAGISILTHVAAFSAIDAGQAGFIPVSTIGTTSSNTGLL